MSFPRSQGRSNSPSWASARYTTRTERYRSRYGDLLEHEEGYTEWQDRLDPSPRVNGINFPLGRASPKVKGRFFLHLRKR
jgi:hypothetical protein